MPALARRRSAADLGRLDAEAIERVRARGVAGAGERRRAARRAARARLRHRRRGRAAARWRELARRACSSQRRATRLLPASGADASDVGRVGARVWVAAERLPQFELGLPRAPGVRPRSRAPAEFAAARGRATRPCSKSCAAVSKRWARPPARRSRRRCSSRSARSRARWRAWSPRACVLRGRFTPGADEIEWCERALLARIHRYTVSGCARRSSRSQAGISCASCFAGSIFRPASSARVPMRSTRSSRSCRDSRRPPRRGSRRSFPRDSRTTSSRGSTTCAFRVAPSGRD